MLDRRKMMSLQATKASTRGISRTGPSSEAPPTGAPRIHLGGIGRLPAVSMTSITLLEQFCCKARLMISRIHTAGRQACQRSSREISGRRCRQRGSRGAALPAS